MDRFERELTTQYAGLIGFARTLTGNLPDAQDLVQDTMMRAMQHRDGFTLGTNMRAWLMTIMRNNFLSLVRRQKIRKFVTLDDPEHPVVVGIMGDQLDTVTLEQTLKAKASLYPHMQRALELAAQGFSYDEMSEMIGIPVGTTKSRVSRSRRALEAALESGKGRLRSGEDMSSPEPMAKPAPRAPAHTQTVPDPLAFIRARLALPPKRETNVGTVRIRTFELSWPSG